MKSPYLDKSREMKALGAISTPHYPFEKIIQSGTDMWTRSVAKHEDNTESLAWKFVTRTLLVKSYAGSGLYGHNWDDAIWVAEVDTRRILVP